MALMKADVFFSLEDDPKSCFGSPSFSSFEVSGAFHSLAVSRVDTRSKVLSGENRSHYFICRAE